jgi:hypothetical protein
MSMTAVGDPRRYVATNVRIASSTKDAGPAASDG